MLIKFLFVYKTFNSESDAPSEAVITIFTRYERGLLWENMFDEAISMFLSIYGRNVKEIVEMYRVANNYDKTNPSDKLLWPLNIDRIMKGKQKFYDPVMGET